MIRRRISTAGQRGVAVVLAMGVVAMAAVAAMAIMTTQGAWTRRAELAAGHAQARLLVLAGIDWSRAVLSEDSRTGSVDHLGEPWALRLPAVPVDNGRLEGFLEDQQGKFNLNNLVREGKVNPDQLARFRRLLSLLGLPDALADTLADWIDADGETQPRGAEDGYYLARRPACLAANRALSDVDELALVAGYAEDVRERLRPFVSALPGFTAVNVNTAPPEVLATVVDGLDIEGARALAEKRANAYFRDRADFLSRLPRGASAANEDIAVNSEYFMTTLRVAIGETEGRGTALLARRAGAWPTLLWRKAS